MAVSGTMDRDMIRAKRNELRQRIAPQMSGRPVAAYLPFDEGRLSGNAPRRGWRPESAYPPVVGTWHCSLRRDRFRNLSEVLNGVDLARNSHSDCNRSIHRMR